MLGQYYSILTLAVFNVRKLAREYHTNYLRGADCRHDVIKSVLSIRIAAKWKSLSDHCVNCTTLNDPKT